MHETNYRQALYHGWTFVVRHKFLWLFGVAATFLGQFGILDLLVKSFASLDSRGDLTRLMMLRDKIYDFRLFFDLPPSRILLIIFLIALIAFVLFLLIFVAISAQGALIEASAEMTRKKKSIDMSRIWHVGTGHFWRLLAVNIIRRLVIFVLSIGASIMAIMYVGQSPLSNLLFLLVVFIILSITTIISFIMIYAGGYIVVDEERLFPAIRKAWHLFMEHKLVSLEVAGIMILLNLLLVAVVIIGFLIVFFPTTVLVFVSMAFDARFVGFITTSSIIFYTAFVILLGSIFTVFHIGVWTDLFMTMHRHGLKSRVVHFIRKYR